MPSRRVPLALEPGQRRAAAIDAHEVAVVLQLVADDGEVLDHLLFAFGAEFEVDSEIDGRVRRLPDKLRLHHSRSRVEFGLIGAAVRLAFGLFAVVEGTWRAVRAE